MSVVLSLDTTNLHPDLSDSHFIRIFKILDKKEKKKKESMFDEIAKRVTHLS